MYSIANEHTKWKAKVASVSLKTPRQEECIVNSVLKDRRKKWFRSLLGFLAFHLFTRWSISALGCKQSLKSDASFETSALGLAAGVPSGLPFT